ncbi:hypothetical protein [Paraburkholderia sp. CI3]|uniref:hypothetical protein n=1 Tax=unclassified Paraburkholderia TaxID=2615204 RepID=UPI003D228288
MPVTRTVMSIHDDQTGEGTALAFPTMSTCSAIICVLVDRLVGVHKTQGWRGSTNTLFARAVALIGGDRVYELYIAGWNVGSKEYHNISQIQNALGCADVATYVLDYHNADVIIKNKHSGDLVNQQAFQARKGKVFTPSPTSDLCTFAFHTGKRNPTIGIKRSSKVNITASDNDAVRENLKREGRDGMMIAVTEDIQTPSDHLHILDKHLDFVHVV